MHKFNTLAAATVILLSFATPSQAQAPTAIPTVKARLEHLSGTSMILIISTLSSEIVSITCDKWTMLGIKSYKGQNEFTIPAAGSAGVPGVAVALMESKGFDGYCKNPDSIKAHTDDGDFIGTLDRGAGNWTESTKLTFSAARR